MEISWEKSCDDQNSVQSDSQLQCCCLTSFTCLGVFRVLFNLLFVDLMTATVLFLTGELNDIQKTFISLRV